MFVLTSKSCGDSVTVGTTEVFASLIDGGGCVDGNTGDGMPTQARSKDPTEICIQQYMFFFLLQAQTVSAVTSNGDLSILTVSAAFNGDLNLEPRCLVKSDQGMQRIYMTSWYAGLGKRTPY